MCPLDMDGDVEALTGRLQVLAVCIFLVQPPTQGVVSCTYEQVV